MNNDTVLENIQLKGKIAELQLALDIKEDLALFWKEEANLWYTRWQKAANEVFVLSHRLNR